MQCNEGIDRALEAQSGRTRTMTTKMWIAALAAAGSLFLSGCGGSSTMSSSGPPPAPAAATAPTSVQVSPQGSQVPINSKTIFVAVGLPAGASQAVQWSISTPGCTVAICGAID